MKRARPSCEMEYEETLRVIFADGLESEVRTGRVRGSVAVGRRRPRADRRFSIDGHVVFRGAEGIVRLLGFVRIEEVRAVETETGEIDYEIDFTADVPDDARLVIGPT